MARLLTDAERTAILEDIRSGALSRNAIARKHGRSPGTVSNIATDAGLEGIAFDRAAVEKATRARTVDMAAARAALQERWLGKANEALDRSEAPCVVYAFSAGTGMYSEHILDQPPASDYRSFVTAAAVATDKLVALAKFDAADTGVEKAASVIDTLMDALRGEVTVAGDDD